MPKKVKISAPGINELIRKLENRDQFVRSHDGRIIDLGTEKTFVSGPFLHQGQEDLSEQESAQFELENEKLFKWLRSFANQVENKV